ncbi:MAG: CpaE family protein [Acidimicrobiia bacterium]
MSLTENNLLVIDEDDDFIDEAKQLFDGGLPTARSINDAMNAIEGGNLRMVILGPSYAEESALDLVRNLRAADPTLISLVVAESVTAGLLRAAMQRGVSDVIEAPLTEEKIASAISQFSSDVLKMQASRPGPTPATPDGPPLGEIVTVMSAKGGSGKTVTATNLAVLLAQQPGSKVCLVDADLQFGDVCLVLQLEPKFTVVNAAAELHRLDEELLNSILTPHHSGLKVLAAPLEPAFADDITTAGLLQILELLKSMFDYVVVDTASLLDELLLSLLEKSDQVLMVVDMDLPSVKNAKLALETLRLLKFPTNKVRLVLNRSNAKARLDDREIEGALKSQIQARIPSDGDVAASVNEGRPMVESQPKSKVAKGFAEVLELVTGDKAQVASGGGLFRRN